jgi:hypothetical protein
MISTVHVGFYMPISHFQHHVSSQNDSVVASAAVFHPDATGAARNSHLVQGGTTLESLTKRSYPPPAPYLSLSLASISALK